MASATASLAQPLGFVGHVYMSAGWLRELQ